MKKENKTKIKKEEIIIDASEKTLGRLSTEISKFLTGKNKPSFERNIFSGSSVKVINASKIKITNKKLDEIYHTRYSGYPGGLKIMKGSYTKETKGMGELVKLAVYRMLPQNKLKREMMKNLKVEN